MAEEIKPEKKEQEPSKPPVVVAEQLVETKHTISIGRRQIKYKALAGTLVLKEEDDEKGEHKPKASIFYTAYFVEGQ